MPAGTAVTAATRRPRSHRVVTGKGTARSSARRRRPCRAMRTRSRADTHRSAAHGACSPRGEVHDGIEPATGLTARHEVVGRSLEPGRDDETPSTLRDDAPDVDVERCHRHAEGRRGDRPGCVRTDPGQRLQLSDRRGHPTAVRRDDRPRALSQRQCPPVVAQSRPRREQLVRPGIGQVDRRRPPIDEPPPGRADPLDPGLLRHDLCDEDLPRVLASRIRSGRRRARASGTAG